MQASRARRTPCRSRLSLALVILLAGGCGDDGVGGAADGTTARAGSVTATTVSDASSGPTAATGLPPTFTVRGVVTDGLAPIEGAIVMQGGAEPALLTAADGSFEIVLTDAISGQPTVVAAKIGYRSDGFEVFEVPVDPIELVLHEAKGPDNQSYVFGDPGTGDALQDNSTQYCGHCHTTYVSDFLGSGHARATRDAEVQDVYAGASGTFDAAACAARGGVWKQGLTPGDPGTPRAKCYVGGGVLGDLNDCGDGTSQACDDPALPDAAKPTRFGACADCHAIGIDGKAGGRNLHDATGIAFEKGNHCDTCHHVREVDLDAPAGNAGALVMQRPREKIGTEFDAPLRQVMFGPYPDVPNGFMGGSYQPQFGEATFCAGCHQYRQGALIQGQALDATRWPDGLPVHATYDEWKGSVWETQGTPCQGCHMPEKLGLTNAIDITTPDDASIAFGFVRDTRDLHAHTFRGPLSVTDGARFIDGAVAVTVGGMRAGDDLEVVVAVENVGAGHAIPTGEPMRALVLLVDATGCDVTFTPNGGTTVPDLGGSKARGVVGADVTVNGATLVFGATTGAAVGDVIRVVRPTGTFEDYAGIGHFDDPTLTPEQKGIEIFTAVGQAEIVAITGGTITVSQAIGVAEGDVVYVGRSSSAVTEGAPVAPLAGAAGTMFQKILVDAQGGRGALHHRAIDIRSDNRIGPKAIATTTYSFAIPPGCTSATIGATLVYRPLPHGLAERFGWDARDHVVASASDLIALPAP